jgi:hypothetical protein
MAYTKRMFNKRATPVARILDPLVFMATGKKVKDQK